MHAMTVAIKSAGWFLHVFLGPKEKHRTAPDAQKVNRKPLA